MDPDHDNSQTPAVSPRDAYRRPPALPPLPDVPACWTWPLPPLPQPCDIERVKEWQDGRCAICGMTTDQLLEDHDHATGDTRGFLCNRCNTLEGRPPAHPVFALYRARYPTDIVGVLHRKRWKVHPRVATAMTAWECAVAHAGRGTYDGLSPEEWDDDERDSTPRWLRRRVRAQLVAAAERVGWTPEEWAYIKAGRPPAKTPPFPSTTGDSR